MRAISSDNSPLYMKVFSTMDNVWTINKLAIDACYLWKLLPLLGLLAERSGRAEASKSSRLILDLLPPKKFIQLYGQRQASGHRMYRVLPVSRSVASTTGRGLVRASRRVSGHSTEFVRKLTQITAFDDRGRPNYSKSKEKERYR